MEIFSISGLMCNLQIHRNKRIRGFLALLVLITASYAAQAQTLEKSTQETDAERTLRERGEVYFCFRIPPAFTSVKFSKYLSVSSIRGDTLFAFANAAGYRQFLEERIPYTILVPPSMIRRPQSRREQDSSWYSRYVTYNEYVSIIQQFAAQYPEICRLRQFGTTPGGHGLYVLKISDNPGETEDEPTVFYSSTMHGDELAGFVLMLRFTEYLLERYQTDSRIRSMVDDLEIWINPLFNPDGTYFTADTTIYGATRFNSAGVDLNRDFPDIADSDTSDDVRQPETLAMMRLLEEVRPVFGANFHGGIEVINYPWDTWSRLHPDNEWYQTLSRAYADTVHAYAPGGYMDDLDNGITNGYAWYQVTGGRQDYVNFFLHGREITVELSTSHTPPEEDLENLWEYNYRSLLDLTERAYQGFSVTVTDSLSGEPLPAIAVLAGHDWDNSYVETDAGSGTFYRLVIPGTHVVSISSPGYLTRTYRVGVTEGNMTRFTVRLFPERVPEIFPNPFTNQLSVYLYGHEGDLVLELTDLSGRMVQHVVQPVVAGGLQTIPLKPMAMGLYVATLRCGSTKIRQLLFQKFP